MQRSPWRIIGYLVAAFLAVIVLSFCLFVCVFPLVTFAIQLPSYSAGVNATATAIAGQR